MLLVPLQGTVVRVGGDPGVPLHFTPGYLLAAPLGLGIWRGVCSVSLGFRTVVEKARSAEARRAPASPEATTGLRPEGAGLDPGGGKGWVMGLN